MSESFQLHTEAPHTGLDLAISNIGRASGEGVEIRPAALRVAARKLNELASHYERTVMSGKVA